MSSSRWGRINGFLGGNSNGFNPSSGNDYPISSTLSTSISDSNGFGNNTENNNGSLMFGSFYQQSSLDSGYSSANGEVTRNFGVSNRFGSYFSSNASETDLNGCSHSPPDRLATRAELQALSNLGVDDQGSSFYSFIGLQNQQTCGICHMNHKSGSYSSCTCSCHGDSFDNYFGTRSPIKPSSNSVSMAHKAFPSLINGHFSSTNEQQSNSFGDSANSGYVNEATSRFGMFELMEESEHSSPNTSIEISGDVRTVNLLLHDQKPLFT